MATANISSSNITLSFAWEGPNLRNGGISNGGQEIRVIDLFFEGATKLICARLAENINPAEPRKINFTCLKNWNESSPSMLKVTEAQIRKLALNAGVFQGRLLPLPKTVLRHNSTIKLEIPEELELGKSYTIVVSSKAFSLSARLIKDTNPSI